MDELDLRIRNEVYSSFVRSGNTPAAGEVAAALGLEQDEVAAALRRLHDAHALVLRAGRDRGPDAESVLGRRDDPRVEAGGRSWFANCAWDALGIPAALHVDGRIDAACPDCGDPLELEVRDGALVRGAELLVHFVVPARRWWDDIGFT